MHFLFFNRISLWLDPVNIDLFVIKIKRIQPALKISDLNEYILPLRTSGAKYPAVPHIRASSGYFFVTSMANPKSANVISFSTLNF